MEKSKGRAIPSVSGSPNSNKASPPQNLPQIPGVNFPENPTAEKLIVVNRPFTWTLVDIDIGPFFTGFVETFEPQNNKLTDTSKTSGSESVFGMNTEVLIPKCFSIDRKYSIFV